MKQPNRAFTRSSDYMSFPTISLLNLDPQLTSVETSQRAQEKGYWPQTCLFIHTSLKNT